MDLKNKVVWITGASSGIGRALTQELATKGCKLVLSSRKADQLIEVSKTLGMDDANFLVLPLDLEKSAEANVWAEQVVKKFGRIDILINNGGISQKSMALMTDNSVERKIMEINYFGQVALTRAVLPFMQKQQFGKIVAISSILGKFSLPQHTTYAASKHAIYGYFEGLRLEINKDNLSVLICAPGFINTSVAKNAVTGDGSILNENSDAQENGLDANVFAKRLAKAISTDKNHIYIGRKEILSVPFKTIFPNLFYKLILKLLRKKNAEL